MHTLAKDIFEAIEKLFLKSTTLGGENALEKPLIVQQQCQVTKLDCCIRKEALVAKRLSEHMKTTLEEVVNILSFIK